MPSFQHAFLRWLASGTTAWMSLILLSGCSSNRVADSLVEKPLQPRISFVTNGLSGGLDYLVYLPPGAGLPVQQQFPLIVFLHGVELKGEPLARLLDTAIVQSASNQQTSPFILVAPSCPANRSWERQPLQEMLSQVEARYPVDKRRVYLTGYSLGGFATWAWAIAEPGRFAAIAPIAGGGDESKACSLKNLRIWAFHGAKDPVVPLQNSKRMVDAVNACGGDARLTISQSGHVGWDIIYLQRQETVPVAFSKRQKRTTQTF